MYCCLLSLFSLHFWESQRYLEIAYHQDPLGVPPNDELSPKICHTNCVQCIAILKTHPLIGWLPYLYPLVHPDTHITNHYQPLYSCPTQARIKVRKQNTCSKSEELPFFLVWDGHRYPHKSLCCWSNPIKSPFYQTVYTVQSQSLWAGAGAGSPTRDDPLRRQLRVTLLAWSRAYLK